MPLFRHPWLLLLAMVVERQTATTRGAEALIQGVELPEKRTIPDGNVILRYNMRLRFSNDPTDKADVPVTLYQGDNDFEDVFQRHCVYHTKHVNSLPESQGKPPFRDTCQRGSPYWGTFYENPFDFQQKLVTEQNRRAANVAALSKLEAAIIHDLAAAVETKSSITLRLLLNYTVNSKHFDPISVIYHTMDWALRWHGNAGQHHGTGWIEGYCTPSQALLLGSFGRLLRPRLVCEIGFNAGHSAASWLMSHSNARVMSFDLGEHSYHEKAREAVRSLFPDRHSVITGDSAATVVEAAQTMAEKAQESKFTTTTDGIACDVVYVDGNHEYEGALHDIINMMRLSHDRTVLIVDDAHHNDVKKAWDRVSSQGWVTQTTSIEQLQMRGCHPDLPCGSVTDPIRQYFASLDQSGGVLNDRNLLVGAYNPNNVRYRYDTSYT